MSITIPSPRYPERDEPRKVSDKVREPEGVSRRDFFRRVVGSTIGANLAAFYANESQVQGSETGYSNSSKSSKPRGHWRNLSNVAREMKSIAREHGGVPCGRRLSQIHNSLYQAVTRYHGGLAEVKKKLRRDE